jgi:disulfide bond formation protein DsbB
VSAPVVDRLAHRAPALILAASAAILATALASQFLGGLPPCELCHWQRLPYAVAIALAGAAMLRPSRALVALCAGAFAVGAGLALYHVGVERGWFAAPGACSADVGAAQTVEELRRRLEAAPLVRCTDVAWSLFGISMAGYNAIASAALAGYALAAAGRRARTAEA